MATDTTTCDKPSAMSKVLSTTELTEVILSKIGPADIMRARRVNKFFRNVVTGSLQLQRKAWLKHDASGTAVVLNRYIFPRVTTRSVFREHFHFRIADDPGHTYALGSVEPSPSRVAAGKPGKLYVFRLASDTAGMPRAKLLPTEYMKIHLFNVESGGMPIRFYTTSNPDTAPRVEKMSPEGCTLGDLLQAIMDSFKGLPARGARKRQAGINLWESPT